jgi:hypothetical protein
VSGPSTDSSSTSWPDLRTRLKTAKAALLMATAPAMPATVRVWSAANRRIGELLYAIRFVIVSNMDPSICWVMRPIGMCKVRTSGLTGGV